MPPARSRLPRRIQRSIEEYTPNGTVGRLVIAALSGLGSGISLYISLVFFFNPVLISLLFIPLFGSVGVATAALAFLMLWPIYVSAIGNVDSPAGYAANIRASSDRQPVDAAGSRRTSGGNDQADEALTALRNRYARGEISDQAFEQRLERLLETESVDQARLNVDRRANADPQNNHAQPQRESELE